jgi:hypothetical protein
LEEEKKMQPQTANSARLKLGTGSKSAEEIFSSVLKRWRQRIGYCSILAAIPATGLSSHVSEARSDGMKKPNVSVAERVAKRPPRLNMSFSTPALLKRQSDFRLPHQNPSFVSNDDCPGRAIPGATYTAAAPYIDTGDTRGANDTVNHLVYYYYYSFDAAGPDHIYSFTLTNRGANPQIQVSAISGTYKPLIYISTSDSMPCPAGTGNSLFSWWPPVQAAPGGTATISSDSMNFLPLNVPIYLFIDSPVNDATGSGTYSIRMQDVTIAGPAANPNPINNPDFFVRQQYLDFLLREPDTGGFNDWLNVLNNCNPSQGGLGSPPECDRVHVSSGFFRSTEFGERGYWIYRYYDAALGRRPQFAEFVPDLRRLSGFTTEQEQEAARASFAADIMARSEFTSIYGGLTTPANAAQFIAKLEEKAQVTLPETVPPTESGQPPQYGRSELIQRLQGGQFTAAQTLRAFIEQKVVFDAFFYRAFVAMQYFGYLQRDPEPAGYDDWVFVLTNGRGSIPPGDYRHLIFGFIYSVEYRTRFGPP